MPLDVNILIRGQSNAAFFSSYGAAEALAHEVQARLGFNGTTERVTLLGGPGTTEEPGAPFIRNPQHDTGYFVTPSLPPGGWTQGPLEARLLAYLARLPAPIRAAPTLTLWMHNESDSNYWKLSTAQWLGAVRADAAWVRASLHQPPATTPYMFVWIPFDIGGGPVWQKISDSKSQFIKLGIETLIADRGFDALPAPQTGDVDMDGIGGQPGGLHLSRGDAFSLVHRLARAIACHFRPLARPGSPAMAQPCDPARPGPTALQARRTGPNRAEITLISPNTPYLAALSPAAAAGIGWLAIAPDGQKIPAVAVEEHPAPALSPTLAPTLAIRFSARLPPGCVLTYGWAKGRLAAPGAPGHNGAIYDRAGIPLSLPAGGIALTTASGGAARP